ncbi:MAG: hypothetical protein JSS66_05810 [Armatimonadetes bacterium]|nr:hypothetical protein [Armatimonadota bacterium]
MSNSEKYFKRGETVPPNSIVLVGTKFPHNVGMVLRLAACHGIGQVWTTGQRIWNEVDALDRVPREERIKGYRDVQLVWHPEPLPPLAADATPIAVEFRPNSECLFDFEHPEKPIYIFGPEDGTLDRSILVHCHRFVKIDSMECLNLATAAATLLYDQRLKEHQARKLALV